MSRSGLLALRRNPPGASLALAGLVLAFFHLVGFLFLDGFALNLGSFDYPTAKYLKFVGLWVVFGTVAAGSLALAIAHYWSSSRTCKGLDAAWRAVTDNIFFDVRMCRSFCHSSQYSIFRAGLSTAYGR